MENSRLTVAIKRTALEILRNHFQGFAESQAKARSGDD